MNEHGENLERSDSSRSSRRLKPHAPIDELELHRYLDGRVEGRARIVLEDALRSDAAARRTLDALREEARLIREALETEVEPSRRLSDKVLATLHNEERFRVHAARNRRLRWRAFAAIGAAAAVLCCVWLIKPREAAGTLVSGTPATLATRGGDRQPVQKNMRLYEGDSITTTLGQFVRLRLGDALLDIDENSKLTIEKGMPAPAVRLEAGRMGVDAGASQQDVAVYLPCGSAQMVHGGQYDVWLPNINEPKWPRLLQNLNFTVEGAHKSPGSAANCMPAVVTALSGTAFVDNDTVNRSVMTISKGQQALYSREKWKWQVRSINLTTSHVITERSWQSYDGVAPRERIALGLLEPPDFATLAQRFNLTDPPMADAIKLLQDAASLPGATRAEQLAKGQQALRTACAALPESDERWHFGRTLEGLAHLRRGFALLEADAYNAIAAHDAFDAARVAFEEALKNSDSTWPRTFANGRTPRLEDLAPVDQSALLATFLHPVALLRVGSPENCQQAAGEFAALRPQLGWSVESLATRLGEGIALSNDVQHAQDAAAKDAFLDVVGFSLDGAGAARPQAEGLKQAALADLVKLHAAAGETEAARQAAEDFSVLFPFADNSPAAQEIKRLQK